MRQFLAQTHALERLRHQLDWTLPHNGKTMTLRPPEHLTPTFGLTTPHSARAAADLAEGLEAIEKARAEALEAKTARGLVNRIVEQIRSFEGSLEKNQEVGIRLVSFGQTIVIHVKDIDYEQPNMVIFIGFADDAQPVRLIQHMSQLSFLLTRVPRLNPNEERQPIGFKVRGE